MCFSAQASFAAAAVVGSIGIAAMHKARGYKIMPFAAGPLLFGVQQAAEGIVWLSLHGTAAPLWGTVGMYVFSFFAFCFWPVMIPYAVYCVEEQSKRKRLLRGALGIGIALSLFSALGAVWYGFAVHDIGHHLVYVFRWFPYGTDALWYIMVVGSALYLCATAGAVCVSSVAGMPFLSVLGLVSFVIAQVAYYTAFASVWCFFAALLSVVSYGIIQVYVERHRMSKS